MGAPLRLHRHRLTSFTMTPTELAHTIDHTLLKPAATRAEVRQLCAEALEFGFATVCVNPIHISLCAEVLRGSPVKVCTVIGFPLGADLPAVKAFQAEQALAHGAQELDMVLALGHLKEGNPEAVRADMAAVRAACPGHILKVILETHLLTEDEKVLACQLAAQTGLDFVKTATGFTGGGATVADVQLMRHTVGPHMGVKASGGIRSLDEARALLLAGANRLGTSAGAQLMRQMTVEAGTY